MNPFMCSFGYFQGVILWFADVSEPSTSLHQAFEDGTDRGFRNVGKPQSDAGEIPQRTYTIYNI
jgi:hypothetical protein